jgi:hypothetical protein
MEKLKEEFKKSMKFLWESPLLIPKKQFRDIVSVYIMGYMDSMQAVGIKPPFDMITYVRNIAMDPFWVPDETWRW